LKKHIMIIYCVFFTVIYGISFLFFNENANFSFLIFMTFAEPYLVGPILSRSKYILLEGKLLLKKIILASSLFLLSAFLMYLVNSTVNDKYIIFFAALLVVIVRVGLYYFVIYTTKKKT